MASVVERTKDGIVYKPARNQDIPDLDLLTMLFDSDWCKTPIGKILHADAADPTSNLTKSALLHQSQKVAYMFRHQYDIGADGPNRDVVFTITSGSYLMPAIFYGIIVSDGIYSAASPAATPEEVAYQLRITNAKLLVCNSNTRDLALAAAKCVGLPVSRVLMYGGKKNLDFHEAASGAEIALVNQQLDWRRMYSPEELDNSIACLLFSSGTTGLPKAMRISHRMLVASSILCLGPIKEYNAVHRPPDFDYCQIAHLPLAHVAGAVSYLVHSVYIGGTTYWMSRFDFPQFCHYFRKYRCTSQLTVPPIFLLIAKSPMVTNHFDTWIDAVSGAAPMGSDVQLDVSKKLGKGNTRVRQTWGLSETTGSITTVPIECAMTVPLGTVGSLMPNCHAKVVDDEGKDVEPGTAGEVWVKGPVVTKGYWNDDEANSASFHKGWFCTGDIGFFRDGWLFLIDRKKELIKYKGEQVAPAELEALLLSNSKILDAAVVGVPVEDTEVPRAYVVADPNEISAEEIIDWVATQVASYKQLRGGVFFINSIPKSPSGKILRKELREMVKGELVSKL